MKSSKTAIKPDSKKAQAEKPFICCECGKALSAKAAEKAMSVGCPNCGGCDIDLKKVC